MYADRLLLTCSTERLLRGCESAISSPNGIGQAMITKLMLEWGYDGYIRWLRGIKATYAMRRDWMVCPGRSVSCVYDPPV